MNDMIRSLLEEQDFIPKSGSKLSAVFCSVVSRVGPVVSHRNLYSGPVSRGCADVFVASLTLLLLDLAKPFSSRKSFTRLQEPLCNILNQESMASISWYATENWDSNE